MASTIFLDHSHKQHPNKIRGQVAHLEKAENFQKHMYQKLCSRNQNVSILNTSGEEFYVAVILKQHLTQHKYQGQQKQVKKNTTSYSEEIVYCHILKITTYHLKSNLEDVTNMHLIWHREVELTNGEQTSIEKVYGTHFQKQ